MNDVDTSGELSPQGGGGSDGGASKHAHHLSKMRIQHKPTTPTTPMTPVAPITPIMSHLCAQQDCVMEDLQLAAELGKTLLERNRELETTIKHQQAAIDDHLQEIEYLSKQTAALREVNDSRLRIYEQLEISIQDLEKTNQRLGAENIADKRKIRGLCGQIDNQEGRCDDLQKQLEEARAHAAQRGRNKRRSQLIDEQLHRRSMSCEHSIQDKKNSDEIANKEGIINGTEDTEPQIDDLEQSLEERNKEDAETQAQIEELQRRLTESETVRLGEVRRREELEIEFACISQENGVLQDQLSILKQKEVNFRSFDEELASLDDDASGRLCRKCLCMVDETASNPTVYDLNDSIEDADLSIESAHGECALIKLKNGGYAWGSQESLASMGRVVSRVGSCGTSPGTDVSDAPHNSLLFELDTQYRILIEKYEALLTTREQQQQQHHLQQKEFEREISANNDVMIHPGIDDMSGPMSVVMTDGSHDPTTLSLGCQHCTTCSCDLKPRQKSNMEECSDVETSSSGFSDGESRLCNRYTQTESDPVEECVTPTPIATVTTKCLDLQSSQNPCDKRFQQTPEYKKIFKEIFTVLKKNVGEKDISKVNQNMSSESYNTSKQNMPKTRISDSDDVQCPSVNDKLKPSVSNTEENKENVHPKSNGKKCLKRKDSIKSSPQSEDDEKQTVDIHKVDGANNFDDSPNKLKQSLSSESDYSSQTPVESDKSINDQVAHKPPRPDSLDLASNSSRSSSRQRRRKRHQKLRVDNVQQPYSGQYQYAHGNNSTQQINRLKQDGNQQPHPQDDYPSLNDPRKIDSRIIYSSTRGRCEHYRTHKHRSGTQHQNSQNNVANPRNDVQRHSCQSRDKTNQSKHYNEPNSSNQSIRHQLQEAHRSRTESSKTTNGRNKINFPSVEVAKLLKLEMSYAEALKSSMNRSYNRKH